MYSKRLTSGLVMILLLVLCSCASSQDEDIAKLKAMRITLPLNDMEYLASFAETRQKQDSLQSELSFVVYKDRDTCSPCEVSHLGQWNSIIKKAKAEIPVKFFFIFAPKEEEHHNVKHLYKSRKFLQSIYLDSHLAFERCNPELNNPRFHSFLMDSEGKLLYVGDPTENYSNEKNLLNVLKYCAEKGQTTLNESLN